jgi:hypothetical protein
MTPPNQEQIKSAIRWLLTAGGPLASILVSKGASADTVNNILTIALIVVPPAVSLIWSMIDHTDAAKVQAVNSVPGVQVGVDTSRASQATPAVQAVANDPKVANVNPL